MPWPDSFQSPGMLLGAAAGAAALVGAALVGVSLVLRGRRLARNLGVVVEGRLYRSGRLTPRTLKLLRDKLSVRTVIDLGATHPGSKDEAAIAKAAADLGITRHSCRGLRGDGTGNPNVYAHALRLLAQEHDGPVLIHCAAGADRTGVAVALYRHAVQGLSLEDAMAEARRYRHDPARSPGTRPFVDQHAAAIVRAWRDGGTIEGFPPADVRTTPPGQRAHEPHLPAGASAAQEPTS